MTLSNIDNSLGSDMDSNEYLISPETYDELATCAYCLMDELRKDQKNLYSLATVPITSYLNDITMHISNVFGDKPYNTKDVFIEPHIVSMISKNILYIIMYSNIDLKELTMYLSDIFKEHFVERLIYLFSPILELFKEEVSNMVGFDFYTIDVFNVKEDAVDLAVVSI